MHKPVSQTIKQAPHYSTYLHLEFVIIELIDINEDSNIIYVWIKLSSH